MDPKGLISPFPASGALLDAYPELSCDELREELARLRRKQRDCDCLDFSEIEEANRLSRTLQEREENGQC